MIRSFSEAKEKLAKALETASVCLVFGLPLLLSLQFIEVGNVWRFIVPIFAFVLAVVLPTFVYGMPRYRLKWTVLGRECEGAVVSELASIPTPLGVPEVTVAVDLVVELKSLWALNIHRKNLAREASVWVELLPPRSVHLKWHETGSSGGARLQEEWKANQQRQYMVLPLTSTSEKIAQARFFGSIVFWTVVSGANDCGVSASLRVGSSKGILRTRAISTENVGVHSFKVRS